MIQRKSILAFSKVDQSQNALIKHSNTKYLKKQITINKNKLKIRFEIDRQNKTILIVVDEVCKDKKHNKQQVLGTIDGRN